MSNIGKNLIRDKSRPRSPRRRPNNVFSFETPMAIELRRMMIRLGGVVGLEGKQTIMVCSAQRGEGKSLFAQYLSQVLAHHLKGKVLLVDGDIRLPVQHTVFEVDRAPGFAELLAGRVPLEKTLRQVTVPNLTFMPAGRPHGDPSRLFTGNRVKEVFGRLKELFDIILLDSPPVVPVSDPLHYVDAVDGVLYLVLSGQTPREMAVRGVEILRSADANILGVVANNLSEVLPYYYDQKYYGYESGK